MWGVPRPRRVLPIFAAGLLVTPALAGGAGTSAGDLDPSFGLDGKVLTDFGAFSNDEAFAVVLQPDGKIVAAGTGTPGATSDFALARYEEDGELDPGFGSGGRVSTDLETGEIAFAVALQSDGKIVAAGFISGDDFALVRYNVDGSLDSSFGSGGKVLTDFQTVDEAFAVALQPDGKIVAGGFSDPGANTDFALARYNVDGSLDSSFGSGGKVLTDLGAMSSDRIRAVAVQPDGKIVAAGISNARGSSDFAVVRYRKDGSLDRRFGSGGRVLTDLGSSSSDAAHGVALRPGGRIVVAGVSDAGGSSDFAVVRYRRDGSLDRRFGSGGRVLTDLGSSSSDGANGVALQPDGRIVAAGISNAVCCFEDFALVRYLAR